jgi:hypothetical protein
VVVMGVLLIVTGLYAVWESEQIIQEKQDKRHKR